MDERTESSEAGRAAVRGRVEQTLLAHRARFLSTLARRTGDRALAEDVLQAAYLRVLERGAPEVGEEGLVAWFQALLRNAWIDRARRATVEQAAARRLEAEADGAATDPALREAICGCLQDAVAALKPEYAEVLRQVDLGGRALGEVAVAARITPNNAAVRLHRARQALGRRLWELCGACAVHGCLDCACRGAGAGGRPA